jgi:hypothetical protein
MIAINQDELGVQADLIKREVVKAGYREIWGSWLSLQRFVVVFFNRGEAVT